MRSLLLVLVLAVCEVNASVASTPAQRDPREAYVRHISVPGSWHDIYAVTDTVTGVVCYTTEDTRGGISCFQPRVGAVESPR